MGGFFLLEEAYVDAAMDGDMVLELIQSLHYIKSKHSSQV
jgi:hypothetical protein